MGLLRPWKEALKISFVLDTLALSVTSTSPILKPRAMQDPPNYAAAGLLSALPQQQAQTNPGHVSEHPSHSSHLARR